MSPIDEQIAKKTLRIRELDVRIATGRFLDQINLAAQQKRALEREISELQRTQTQQSLAHEAEHAANEKEQIHAANTKPATNRKLA